jgi:hypothetical protein
MYRRQGDDLLLRPVCHDEVALVLPEMDTIKWIAGITLTACTQVGKIFVGSNAFYVGPQVVGSLGLQVLGIQPFCARCQVIGDPLVRVYRLRLDKIGEEWRGFANPFALILQIASGLLRGFLRQQRQRNVHPRVSAAYREHGLTLRNDYGAIVGQIAAWLQTANARRPYSPVTIATTILEKGVRSVDRHMTETSSPTWMYSTGSLRLPPRPETQS